MAWREVIEQTAVGLGYEVVDIEYSGRGLLRVTIDTPYVPGEEHQTITVEDCERLTRQLAFVLEVEALAYTRLEISSPGIDRPLRGEKDFERFAGSLVDITLKAPIGGEVAGDSGVSGLRKKFRGILEKTPTAWQVVWSTEAPEKPGRRISKKRPPAPLQALGFSWDEVKEARLAPIVNFKGRSAAQETGVEDES